MIQGVRRTALLLTLVGAFVLTCTGVVMAHEVTTTTNPSSQSSTDHKESTDRKKESKKTVSGIFAYSTGGETPSGDFEHQVEYFITDDQGEETKLLLTDEQVLQEALKAQGVSKEKLQDGGPQPLVGKRVTVEGQRTFENAKGQRNSDDEKIKVEKIQAEQTDNETSKFDFKAEAAVTGSKPAVTIACKFADNTAEPKSTSYFNSLVNSTTKPGIDHFWREASFNQINLSGGKVVGWYSLPKSRSQYLYSDGSANLSLLAQDCTGVADSSVNFPSYSTINMMFNDEMDGSAWGGFRTLNLDGQTITYGTTWMPPWGYENVGILGHEMGHSYGLPHSSGPYGKTYDSWWDVMSSGGLLGLSLTGRNDCFRDSTYGCMAMHTISPNKDKLGWIPAEQKYSAPSGTDKNLTLDRLGTTASSGNYLIAQIPISGSTTQFYTVEARRPVGYDAYAAAEGLVIHKIDTSQAVGLNRYAYVVDSDNNGNPNDAGATWTAGETFTDSTNKISVRVTGATTNGYNINVKNDAGDTDTVAPTVALTAPADGSTVSGTSVALKAEASDDKGVADVMFYVYKDEAWSLVGTDTTAGGTSGKEYSYTWDSTSLPDGQSYFYAVAVDGAGNGTYTQSRAITVKNTTDTTAPTISLTSPADNATVSGTSVALKAEASDDKGVADVLFYVYKDGAWSWVGTDTTAGGTSGKEYSYAWDSTSVPDGENYFYADAVDEAGNGTYTDYRTITVKNADTTAPTVSLTAPASGATVSGSSVALSADATDDKAVTRVDFYVGSTKVGTDTTAGGTSGKEYSYAWDSTSVSDGSSTVTARAYDAANNEKISSSRTVTVKNATPDTTAPTVSLTSPADGATVSGKSVAFKAEASDNTSVSDVLFYVWKDSAWSWVGTDTTASGTSGKEYSYTWDSTSLPDGQSYFYAVAVDGAGNGTYTQSRAITVDNSSSGGDTQAPTVYSSNPIPNKTGVKRGANVSVTFSEAMKAGTLNSSNVALYKNGTGSAISATATPNTAGTSVTLNPTARLASKTRYMVVLWRDTAETGVQDVNGNLIGSSGSYSLSGDGKYVYYWFTTGRK